MVARDVAGEDAVPEAIIEARCADEHTDDPMRTMQLRDCETTTFCPTHSQAPLPKTRTYPTPRRAKFGPREGSLCMRHVCEHFPLSQLRFCAARFRLLNKKVRAVFSVRETPSPCRPIPVDNLNQIIHNMPFVIPVVCVGLPLECGGYKRHHMPTLRMHL